MFGLKRKRSFNWNTIKVGDRVVAETDVPCPMQPFELDFSKGEVCTVVGEGINEMFRWVEIKGKETSAKFALEPHCVLDFIGAWFKKGENA